MAIPKDYKPVTADLKRIYRSVTEEEALQALDDFSGRWDDKYPQISRSAYSGDSDHLFWFYSIICVFHAKPATDSRARLPPIPDESCH